MPETTTVVMDDGVRLNVKVLGQDPTARKPLLISLHGAPGVSTLAEPESSFGYLSDKYRVLVFDARGSGASDKIGPFTHERWIQDIENLRCDSGDHSQ
jgi:proline iminopeptidase